MKSFTQYINEMTPRPMTAQQSMRLASRQTGQNRIKQAGGNAFLRGTVAGKTGLSTSQLALLQRRETSKSGRIPNSQAQAIARAVFSGN